MRRFRFRVRLLPVAIVGAALMLSVKARDIWTEAGPVVDQFAVGISYAETVEPGAGGNEAAADMPAPADGEAADASSGTGIELDETYDPMLFTRAEVEILQTLQVRRRKLEEREREFALREQVLKATQAALDSKIEELKAMEKNLEVLLGQFDEKRAARLKSLVKIYENMKPKDAAQIFANLEGEILLDVVEGMREAKAAPVLALLEPEQAKRITVELAERSKDPAIPPAE